MIVGFIPVLGGAGATSLLLSTAARLAATGTRSVMVDADPLAELSSRLGKRPPRPLRDVFQLTEGSDAGAVQVAPRVLLVPTEPGRFVGGGVGFASSTLRSCAGAYADQADVVLLDLPPFGGAATEAGLGAADAVILVVPPHSAGLRALPSALRSVLAARSAPRSAPRLLALAVSPVRPAEPSSRLAGLLCARCRPHVLTLSVPYDLEVDQRTSLDSELHDPGVRGPYAEAVEELRLALRLDATVPQRALPSHPNPIPRNATLSVGSHAAQENPCTS